MQFIGPIFPDQIGLITIYGGACHKAILVNLCPNSTCLYEYYIMCDLHTLSEREYIYSDCNLNGRITEMQLFCFVLKGHWTSITSIFLYLVLKRFKNQTITENFS